MQKGLVICNGYPLHKIVQILKFRKYPFRGAVIDAQPVAGVHIPEALQQGTLQLFSQINYDYFT